MDNILQLISRILPKTLVKWCFYRVLGHATTGKHSKQNVAKLSWQEAAERWDEPDFVNMNHNDPLRALVQRSPGFFLLLFLGMILAFFIGSSLLCKINYNAGVLRGVRAMKSLTIECDGYIVNWNDNITNVIYGKISLFGEPGEEMSIQMWDGGSCHQPNSPWHTSISRVDRIVMYNFKYPDWQRIESNKAVSRAEMQALYDEVQRTGVTYSMWSSNKKAEFEKKWNNK